MAENNKDTKKEKPVDERRPIIKPNEETLLFLSNERTFLSWIRTSLATISMGFVIAKFGIWLEDFSLTNSPRFQQIRSRDSVPIGIGMIVFGGILSILAAWRYRNVNLQIEGGKVKADRGLIISITLLVLILSLVMVVYMIIATKQF